MSESPKLLKRLEISERSKPFVEPIFSAERKKVSVREVKAMLEIDAILERATKEAEEVVSKAVAEAASIREEAREQGKQEAWASLTHELAKVRAERQALLQEAESEALDLAFALARRIISKKIEAQPELVRDVLKEVAQSARGRRSLVFRVHPDDLELVRAQQQTLSQELEGAAVYFDDDATLSRGECVIETEAGRIDGRLDTQLQILRDALVS